MLSSRTRATSFPQPNRINAHAIQFVWCKPITRDVIPYIETCGVREVCLARLSSRFATFVGVSTICQPFFRLQSFICYNHACFLYIQIINVKQSSVYYPLARYPAIFASNIFSSTPTLPLSDLSSAETIETVFHVVARLACRAHVLLNAIAHCIFLSHKLNL